MGEGNPMAVDDDRAVEERKRRRSSTVVRCHILAAAHVLFMRDGDRETVLRDVARRAGVEPSVLYRHFGTKQSLYAEAVLDPFIRGLDSLSGT
jgi:AcrR family transcriptional regulator